MFEKEAGEYAEAFESKGVAEASFIKGAEFGYKEALKVRINTTTISDAPLMEKEQLAQAKEILKRFVKWFDYISESENWKTIVADARKLLEDK